MQVGTLRSQPRFASGGVLLICLVLALVVSPCPLGCSAQDTVVLVGAGSTQPAPLYIKWVEEYNKRNPALQMRYLPVGTGESIKLISNGVGDFGGGEAPLTASARAEGGLIEVPTILIGIVPIYNLPGVEGELRLSGAVLADIFLGRVKTWNAAAIARLNPQLPLPDLPIKVVYRPAGKGSNYVFSDFLSKSSTQFKAQIGTSASPQWPVGAAAERSVDMAEMVSKEPGAIGFVEAHYAPRMIIAHAAVLNPAGRFVKASAKTLAAACWAVEAPGFDRLSASLTNAPGEESYPITSFSWIYLRAASPDVRHAASMADLLNWMLSSGQNIATQEGYAALPMPLLEKVKAKVNSLH